MFKEKLALTQLDTETMETIAESIKREGREMGIKLGIEKEKCDIAKYASRSLWNGRNQQNNRFANRKNRGARNDK